MVSFNPALCWDSEFGPSSLNTQKKSIPLTYESDLYGLQSHAFRVEDSSWDTERFLLTLRLSCQHNHRCKHDFKVLTDHRIHEGKTPYVNVLIMHNQHDAPSNEAASHKTVSINFRPLLDFLPERENSVCARIRLPEQGDMWISVPNPGQRPPSHNEAIYEEDKNENREKTKSTKEKPSPQKMPGNYFKPDIRDRKFKKPDISDDRPQQEERKLPVDSPSYEPSCPGSKKSFSNFVA
ncbi:MAG: hypothetical protein CMO81_12480 [Waddliaceae bacterium]|nr:hypothetical protein [Waddliaceae bacterium]